MMTKSQTHRIATRLVRRMLLAASPIPEGATFENQNIRVHRFRSAVKIWDLTNAGKRGKMVDIVSVYDLDYLDDAGKALIDPFTAKLRRADFATANKLIEQFMEKVKATPRGHMADVERRKEKGVRVDPGGSDPVEVRGASIAVRIEPQSFWVRDLTDPMNEPTLIPRRRQATSTKRMYVWALSNKAQIKKMTFRQIQDVMSDLGVDYHYYLAMD